MKIPPDRFSAAPIFTSARILVFAAATMLLASPASAALLVYDDFDYGIGTLNGASYNGGTGFSGAWTTAASSNSNTVSSPGLTFGSLETDGNKVSLSPTSANAGTFRQLDDSYGEVDTGPVYISFLINHTGGNRYFGLSLQNLSGTEFGFIGKNTSVSNWRAFNLDSGVSITPNTPTLLVVRLEALAGANNDSVSIWVNPTIGGAEPSANASASNLNFSLASFSRILVGAGFTSAGISTSSGSMDELRLGTDWASVTPIPEPGSALLLGSAGMFLAAFARRRRR